MSTLRRRVVKAGAWTLGAYGFELVARLLTNLIMTRLLFPEAFGIVAAATSIIAALGMMSDFGVRAVVIQNPLGDQPDFLRSAWVFQVLRGIALWGVLVLVCGVISIPAVNQLIPNHSAFASKSFALVTLVMGFSLVMSGAESTAVALNERRLNLRPIVGINIAARMVPLPLMVALAWKLPSVWALVLGALSGGACRLILSHVLLPGPRMGLNWDKKHFKEIFHVGKWLTVSSYATFICYQSDTIILGLLLPASTLGVYSIARVLFGSAQGLMDRLDNSLSVPVFGEAFRLSAGGFRSRYYQYRLPIDISAGLSGGILLVAGSLIVNTLYDARYAQAGIMLQILAVALAIYPLHLIRGAYVATGESRTYAIYTLLQAVSLVVGIIAGYKFYGLLGSVVGIATYRILPSIFIVFLARKRHWTSLLYEARLLPIFLVGAIIGKVLLATAAPLLHDLIQSLHAVKRSF